jgi:hypothetical protein
MTIHLKGDITMGNKLILIVAMLLLCTSLATAWEFTPTKLDFKNSISSDMSDFVKQDYNTKYGALTFTNTILGLIELNKEAEYSLISNTDYCIEDCSATIKATLYSDGVLVDYFDAKDLTGNLVEIRNQKTYINVKEEYQTDIPATYKDVCVLVTNNKTSLKEEKCHKEIATYQIGLREVQQEYKGEIVKAGDYTIQIVGTKGIGVNADWGIGVRGVSADEVRKSWETWTSADCIAGGTITIDGDFCVNTYLTSHTFNVSRAIHNFTVLVVAGGGGGGSEAGGGGGAGGLKLNTTYLPTGNLNVIIGLGGWGSAGVANTNGKIGGNSSFGEIVSFGGGGGRTRNAGDINTSGGSGGGGGYYNQDHGNGTEGQGYDGGSADDPIALSSCAGGGGSFQKGVNGTLNVGGNGGNGTATNINGTWICYAGGGGGCGNDGATTGLGFCGGGRGGGNILATLTAGQNGTGSGGGGTSGGAGGNYGASGGSGIVIVRYLAEKPLITLTQIHPINEYNTSTLTNYFGCSASATLSSISNVTLTIRLSNGTLEYTTTNKTIDGKTNFTNFSYTFTNEGKYSWNCTGRNDNNDYGTTANRNINVTTPSPILNITRPINNSNLSYNNAEINYTIIDTDLTDCFWSKDMGAINTSIVCGTNITGQTWSQGANTIIIWANDSMRHKVSASVYFTVDTIYPIVNISSPFNASSLNYNVVVINWTLIETNPSDCFYSNNRGATNTSTLCGTNFSFTAAQGWNNVTVWANDTNNRINSSFISYFVDSIYPVINITRPLNKSNLSYNNVEINYTLSDANLNSCWWSNNFGASNTSLTCGTNITGQTWTQGNNNITIWANDTINNVNRSDVYFLVDTSAPTITISSPTNNKIYTAIQNIDLNYSATDGSPITCAFAIDGGANTSTSCATNTTINTTVGDHSVIVYATDSFGNVGTSSQINFTNVNITVSRTYNASAIEGSSQYFAIKINKSANVTAVGYLYYNNTKYSANKIDELNYDYSLNVPLITSLWTNNSFFWEFNFTYRTSTLFVNTSVLNQTIYKVFISFCNATNNLTYLNYTIYDSPSNVPMNATFQTSIQYYSTSNNVINYSYSDLSNNNSNFMFCSNIATTIVFSGVASYYNSSYDRREYLLQNVSVTTGPLNIPLYLSTTASTAIVTFTVTDQNYKPLSGAIVTVQQWDIGSNNYTTIGMFTTGNEGTGLMNLVLYNQWYRAIVTYNGFSTITNVQKLSSQTWNIIMDLNNANPYTLFGTTVHGLVFNETTNITTFNFADSSGNILGGCLVLTNYTNVTQNIVAVNCSNISSASLSYRLPSGYATYIAYGKLYLGSAYNYTSFIADSLVIQVGNPPGNVVKAFGKVISLMLIGTSVLIGVSAGSVILSALLLVASFIGVWQIGWLDLTWSIIWGIVMAVIIIMAILKRRGG